MEIHELKDRATSDFIEAVAEWYPRGSLYCHIHGLTYSDPSQPFIPPTSATKLIPVAWEKPKRASGKNYKPGKTGWVKWRRGKLPGDPKFWPSNFHKMGEWRQLNDK